jgi:hypothetical protein
MMRATFALAALLAAAPALAQEPVGCDKFKWPLDRERAMLATPVAAAPSAKLGPLASAFSLRLAPADTVTLPAPPSRAPKSGTNAGTIAMTALPKAGTYRVTLAGAARVDVIQGGHEIKSSAFSGALGCDGIRKSVKFELTAEPFIIEITGTTANSIALVVTED